jgi:hypothetical protein
MEARGEKDNRHIEREREREREREICKEDKRFSTPPVLMITTHATLVESSSQACENMT